MARRWQCDTQGHEEAKYLVGDLDTGDQMALCIACWVVMCQSIAEQTANPSGPSGPPPDLIDLDGDTVIRGDDTLAEVSAKAAERDERTRARLAARPDAATTSEAAVPWPLLSETCADCGEWLSRTAPDGCHIPGAHATT